MFALVNWLYQVKVTGTNKTVLWAINKCHWMEEKYLYLSSKDKDFPVVPRRKELVIIINHFNLTALDCFLPG